MKARKRGRPVLSAHRKIQHQDKADKPVVNFVERHMASSLRTRGARARAIDAAVIAFPGKSAATIERILSRQSDSKQFGRTFTSLWSQVAETAAQTNRDLLAEDAIRAVHEEFRQGIDEASALIKRYLSEREQEELRECSVDLLIRIARDRQELARLRRRRTPSNK